MVDSEKYYTKSVAGKKKSVTFAAELIIAILIITKRRNEKGYSSRELSFSGIQGYVE